MPKSDRIVVFTFITLIIVIGAIIMFVGGKNNHTTAFKPDSINYDSPYANHPYGYSRRNMRHIYYYVEGKKKELFPFDPNTADSTELLRLGLQPWQVRNIYKYRAHGGTYKEVDDFSRLYGLTKGQWERLKPYIRISPDYKPLDVKTQVAEQIHDTVVHKSNKIHGDERVELNMADTTKYQMVPGIGPYFARKIFYYYQRLGGFYSVSQLREIEDFPEESIKYFIADGSKITKINVNKLSVFKLRKHPYMNFYQAKAIVDYRRANGPLHHLEELQNLRDFPAEAIKRLEPYVEY